MNNFILYLLSCLISYLYGYIGSTGYKHFCFKFFTKLCFFFLPVYVAESHFRFTTLQFVYNFSHLRCMFFSIEVPTVALALHVFFFSAICKNIIYQHKHNKRLSFSVKMKQAPVLQLSHQGAVSVPLSFSFWVFIFVLQIASAHCVRKKIRVGQKFR